MRDGNETILLIEEEAAVSKTLQRMLQRLGYQVTAYDDDEAAPRAFQHGPDAFDLILTGIAMSGDEVTKRFLAVRPDVRILIHAGYGERIDGGAAKVPGSRGI